jgi:folate-binding protein YgfZ
VAGIVRDRYEMVRVSGPDARRFLDGLLSQDLAALHPQRALRSFLLSPQGKLRALLWVAGNDEQVDLYTDRGLGTRVTSDLAHYKIRIKADIAAPSPAVAFLDEIPVAAVAAPLGDRMRSFGTDDPGGIPIPEATWDAIRIEAGEPIMDRDVDEKTIPQETGLVEEAVSFEKGCYLGQELVSRLDSRQGRVNRNLRRVEIDGALEAPVPARVDGEEVGAITSIATSSSRTLGLGLLHRRVEPGDLIEVGERRAEVLGSPL